MSQPHPHMACICLVFLDDATPAAHWHMHGVTDSSSFAVYAACSGDIASCPSSAASVLSYRATVRPMAMERCNAPLWVPLGRLEAASDSSISCSLQQILRDLCLHP